MSRNEHCKNGGGGKRGRRDLVGRDPSSENDRMTLSEQVLLVRKRFNRESPRASWILFILSVAAATVLVRESPRVTLIKIFGTTEIHFAQEK